MNYSRPSVMVNETLAEGVYAASGSTGGGDCWSVSGHTTQDYVDGNHIYEISAVHSTGVVHITDKVTYTFTFAQPLTHFHSEWDTVSGSGNTWTVERNLHANGYHSGDNVTFKIWAGTGDEATTKSLPVPAINWSCTHKVNVQGGFD